MRWLKPPGAMMPVPVDAESARARIKAKVKVSPEGCWLFQGATNYDGYGTISMERRSWTVHRLMYALAHGVIPDSGDRSVEKRFVLHRCDTPACCNPDHLYLGSAADNGRDMTERCRVRSRTEDRFGKVFWAIRGEVRTLDQWAAHFGVNSITLDQRLRKGWSASALGRAAQCGNRYLGGREHHVRLSGTAAAEQFRRLAAAQHKEPTP